jgi:hypothetical protein
MPRVEIPAILSSPQPHFNALLHIIMLTSFLDGMFSEATIAKGENDTRYYTA